MITTNQLLIVLLVFLGSCSLNFISIHLMSNLILTEGSSRRKSLSLSAQYALVTATLLLITFLALNFIGAEVKADPLYSLLVVISSDGGLVFLLRWLYTKKVYDTTYLHAFIVVQWLYILISIIMLIIALNFAELPDPRNFLEISNATSSPSS